MRAEKEFFVHGCHQALYNSVVPTNPEDHIIYAFQLAGVELGLTLSTMALEAEDLSRATHLAEKAKKAFDAVSKLQEALILSESEADILTAGLAGISANLARLSQRRKPS